VTDDTDGWRALDVEVREEALDVLRDVVHWWATEARWAKIRSTVADLAAAVRRSDTQAAREAVATLELLGPVRATPFDSEPTVPPPAGVREEINELVDTLDGDAAASS
jgi:hypothetical protein